MKKFIFSACILAVSLQALAAGKTYSLQSPSGEIRVEVQTGDKITWALSKSGSSVLQPSAISLSLADGTVLGGKDKPSKVKRRSADENIVPVIYHKSSVRDHYNEMTLAFRQYSLVFRAYDDGAAYRFITSRKESFRVKNEQAEFRFAEDAEAFIPYTRKRKDNFECQFFTAFESLYTRQKISGWLDGRLAFLPITLNGPGGSKVCITESDLRNYPGMYLSNENHDTALEAVFAPFPKTVEQGGHNMLQGIVTAREDYIAELPGKSDLPWRLVIVENEDKDLLACDLPWLLGKPQDPSIDFSWVKPGKVAWDWWNAWNLYGVDFEAGINNETYKYYIDFAAAYGLEYVILDEGWAVNKKADLFQVIPEIDLKELAAYAEKKGVGLILWAGYLAFEKDMERACREYSAMGIKGFKVDFMDRDDQNVVQFYERTAETAARYHLLIDFHGAFKPAGLHRTWPNVINFEGIYGLEHVKGNKIFDIDMVTNEVTVPFVRFVAGPADYTQGAMRNAAKGNFRFVSSEGMSQGTRCRQLAEYVVFNAPLTMLCDSPSNYMQESECLDFISKVPTTWDETVPLEGKAGEYVAVARRKGDVWYIGAITDWNARELSVNLPFLAGKSMDIFCDGANAHRAGRDYRHTSGTVPADGVCTFKMAPGGGWAAIVGAEESKAVAGYANRAEAIAAQIHDPDSRYVVVACHRGDWRNYPENSIPAIESVIRMGADIVEIDIHMTADSVLVLCHDSDVRRTTDFSKVFRGVQGKSAKVSDLTIDEIKRLKLKRAHGVTTDDLRMPTLREALLCAKDRICVNIDKGYDYYDAALALTEELGVTDQVLIKGKKSIEEVAALESKHTHNMMYMPIVDIQKPKGKALFDSYIAKGTVPLAYEVCWGHNNDDAFAQACKKIKAQGSKIWVNTIWASLCGGAGNDDDAAFQSGDCDAVYQQYIDKGVSMFQTDRPEQLIGWLKKKGLHTLK